MYKRALQYHIFLLAILTLGLSAVPMIAAEKVVETLIHDLKSPSDVRRKEAAKALGDRKIQSATPSLIEAANDPNPQVRKEIVMALDKMRDPRAIPTFISLLSATAPEIKRRCVAALVNLHAVRESGFIAGTRKIVDKINPLSSADDDLVVEPYTHVEPAIILALKDRLSDPDRDVREDAARALGIMRGKQVVPEMVTSLKQESDSQVKVALIKSLYKIRDTSVGPELLPLIYDSNKRVHDEAILTIGALKTREAVPELMKLYERGIEERKKVFKVVPASSPEDLQLKTLQALAMIGDRASEDFFLKALRHPNAKFRQAGAEGLARVGNSEQASQVSRERLNEKSGNVRLAESYALYRMGRKEFLEDIINSLPALTLNDQAASYLEEFNGAERSELYPYLSSKNDKVRERLAEVLGQVGDMSTLPNLQALTRDKKSNVASAALQSIRRIEARAQVVK